MERRTLLAVVLCFAIFMGWQKLYLEPQMRQRQALQSASQPQQPTADSASVSPRAKSDSSVSNSGSMSSQPRKPRAFESKPVALGTGTAQIGNGARFFTGWDLKSYRLGIAPQAAAVDMKSVANEDAEGVLLFDHPDLAYLNSVQGELTQRPDGVVWTYEDDKVRIVREMIGSQDKAYLDVRLTADFKGVRPAYAFVSLIGRSSSSDVESKDRSLLYWTNQSLQRLHLTEALDVKDGVKEVQTPVKWIATASRYFLMTLVTQGPASEPKGLIQQEGPYGGRISLVYPVSGSSITIPLRAYFGPKELDALRSVDPTLDHAVDFGWFTAFAYPLLKVMRGLYDLFHNYGVAIIVLTLLVKLVTFPLTYKSMKSMKQMAKLQPQLQKLREKYKDDREALNREMMTLMRTHGYNPMAGCLPILIQMPVFFALYQVLYNAIELYHAPFALWIHDLSSKDPYYVTPILLTGVMFAQQKLTPNTATDPVQARMLQFMPVIFGIFMINLPSGLTVYMLVNTLAGVIQQVVLNKRLDDAKHVRAVAARAR